jgi:alkylation response protein AidB-like acyl-CoA dehydrogenase
MAATMWMTEQLSTLRDLARSFFEREAVPDHERWPAQQHVDREFWRTAGELGLLCAGVPSARPQGESQIWNASDPSPNGPVLAGVAIGAVPAMA